MLEVNLDAEMEEPMPGVDWMGHVVGNIWQVKDSV